MCVRGGAYAGACSCAMPNRITCRTQWFNAHNVHWVWALLEREYRQAAQGIEDCRALCTPAEFEGLAQRNLGANAGLDLLQLGALLRFVVHGAAAAAAAAAAERWPGARQAARDEAAPALAFGLRAAGAVLQRLLALMRDVDAAAAALAAEPPYAAEVQANAACLQQVYTALERLGLGHVLPRQP